MGFNKFKINIPKYNTIDLEKVKKSTIFRKINFEYNNFFLSLKTISIDIPMINIKDIKLGVESKADACAGLKIRSG